MGLSLAAVVGLQIATTWGRLGEPFLDTRLHYSYDNAEFGFRMRSGIRNGDLRSQFGVTANTYDRWGEPRGGASYYTDHPFLLKAALQQYGRVVGVTEWATRSFYLLVAVATAAGFYAILVQTTGSLFASAAGAATLVTLPLFSVYQVCVKFEADGMLLAVWIYAAFVAYLRRGTRALRFAYAGLLVAAFLTHWTAILFVGGLAAWQLLLARRYPRARELLGATAAASAAGLVALLALMTYVQGGWTGVRASLTRSLAVRSRSIPFADWGARQLLYLQKNFTIAVAVLSLAMLGLLGMRLWKIRRTDRGTAPAGEPGGLALLAGFVGVSAAVALLWLFLFPQGSFIHVYWQYWFCLPIAALVAGTLAAAEGGRWLSLALWRIAACGLVAFLLLASRRAYGGIASDELGTVADIRFLQTLRDDRFERLVFVPVTETPLTEWFQGPLFLYYTDRPVSVASRPEELRRGDKLLVLRYTDRALVVGRLEGWSGLRLENEKCGPRLCAYDVR